MTRRKKKEFVHEGRYVAEVEVTVIEDAAGWAPYLEKEDAFRLDDVRAALSKGDLETAAKFGTIFEMRPIAQAS